MTIDLAVRNAPTFSCHRRVLRVLSLVLLLATSAFAGAAAPRVGVLVLVGDELSHTRIGMTVLGNSVERVPSRTLQASALVREQVSSYLGELGYTVVPLDWPAGAKAPDDGLVRRSWSTYALRRAYRTPLKQLAEAHALDLLVVFETFEGEDRFGGSSASVGGYGLYSRSGSGKSLAYAQLRGYLLSVPGLDYVGGGQSGRPAPVDMTQIDGDSIEQLESALRPLLESTVRNALPNFRLPRVGPAP